ncbi:hypothetical protein AX16_003971 [Volvariella volvacea WC 439]|nr:hypothetical protein AX16_003971 [Volvariella volvacea WC 439]
MPEIPVGAQIFDLAFHPTHAIAYTGLLTGEVKAFAYNEQGGHEQTFSVRPTKRSCRGLSIDHDGMHLFAVGKAKALSTIDTKTEQIEVRKKAHDSTINRIKCLTPWLVSTGDDDGVIKLWDPRQRECTRTYKQHFDYITDFLWLEDKKQLVATSGDGTLSVMDVRSKKLEPFAQSEDQEDELLSIVAIKGATKVVVGTQLGIMSIFNRSSGWGDCVDRIPGHPHSIDALCSLPPSLPNVDTSSTILTGSSDGFVRAVQLFPTKLLGVIADHGEMPVERIAIGGGEYTVTLGEEVVSKQQKKDDAENRRVTVRNIPEAKEVSADVAAFEMKDNEDQGDTARLDLRQDGSDEDGDLSDKGGEHSDNEAETGDKQDVVEGSAELGEDNDKETTIVTGGVDSDSDAPKAKKRKRKEKNSLAVKKRKPGRNEVQTEKHFFSDL